MGLYLGAALLLFLLLPNQMYVYDLHCLSTDRDRPIEIIDFLSSDLLHKSMMLKCKRDCFICHTLVI